MDLPVDRVLRIGIQTIHRRSEPATGPWLPTIDEMQALVGQVDPYEERDRHIERFAREVLPLLADLRAG